MATAPAMVTVRAPPIQPHSGHISWKLTWTPCALSIWSTLNSTVMAMNNSGSAVMNRHR